LSISPSEVIQSLQSGDVKAISKMGLIDELRQKKIYPKTVPFWKLESGKRAKLFLAMDVRVPFSPFTGLEDPERWNHRKPFQMGFCATTTSLILKQIADQNPAGKAMFMKKAAVDNWDTSDYTTLTDEDKHVFRIYRKPLVFSFGVVGVNDSTITGRDYGVSYQIKLQLDEDGMIVGEKPWVLRIADFCRSVTLSKINELNKAVENAKEGLPYEYHGTNPRISRDSFATVDKKSMSDWITYLFQESFLSPDRPLNVYMCYEFPLSEYNIVGKEQEADYKQYEPDEMAKHRILLPQKKDMSDYLADFTKAGNPNDDNWDFIEFDYIEKTKNNFQNKIEKALASKELKAAYPTYLLNRAPWYKDFMAALNASKDSYGPDTDDMEKSVNYSVTNRHPLVDSEVEHIAQRVSANIPLNSPYISEWALREYADILPDLYGEAYNQLLLRKDEEAIENAYDSNAGVMESVSEILDRIHDDNVAVSDADTVDLNIA